MSLSNRRSAALAAFIGVSLLTLTAEARDDPSREYWTLESEHFRVTYPDNLESVARRVITLSETIHDRITPEMQFTPEYKTEFVLNDDTDGANGSASPIPYDTIRLFVTAPDDLSNLGDYDDWFLSLITHEYTHILHTGNISGVAAIVNRVLGRTFSPNSAQPRWLIEGLAVVYESDFTTGGRIRSSLFDAYLRADVLEDNFAGLDQISSGADRWPYGNIYYLYGSRFMRWMADIYGPQIFSAISADYGATTIPLGINRAIRRVTGVTYEDLYGAWHEHLKLHYGELVKRVDAAGRREGKRLTFRGADASYPRFVPTHARSDPSQAELLYYRGDLEKTSGLYRLVVPDAAEDREDGPDEDLIIRTTSDSAASFGPDGEILFADGAVHRNLITRRDLFSLPKGETSTRGVEPSRKRLTDGLRAAYVDVRPDGHEVTFTVNSRGSTTLAVATRNAEGTLGTPRALVVGKTYEQAYTPRYSPDGQSIVYSAWSEGGFRDLKLVTLSTGEVRDLTRDRALDIQPTWSADGKTIYFSSDRTGIFNVYAMTVATGELAMVTNVVNAALAPTVSPDEKTLVYLGYTKDGYDLFQMPLERSQFVPAQPMVTERDKAPEEPLAVAMERERYNPLKTLRPYNYFVDIGPGNYGSTSVAFTASGSDLVGLHGINAALRFDPGAPEPRISFSYSYGALPVDLGFRFSRGTTPRSSGFSLGGDEVPYDETSNSIGTSVSLPLSNPFVSQYVSLSYSANLFHQNLQTPQLIDPNGLVPKKPIEGFLSQLSMNYSLSTAEYSSKVAGGPRSGFDMRVGLSVADENTGSDSSLYEFDGDVSAYIPMPWPGSQTLALRASAGVSAGNYARRGRYFVGGYDLESNSPLDTVISGVYDGAFVLRGYAPGASAGSAYFQSTAEYRAPIFQPNWGPSTLPLFLRRIDASAFADWGGAFDKFDFEAVRFFSNDRIIDAAELKTSVGLEVWLGLTLAYRIPTDLRVGWAYGFDPGRVPDGQLYVISTSAF